MTYRTIEEPELDAEYPAPEVTESEPAPANPELRRRLRQRWRRFRRIFKVLLFLALLVTFLYVFRSRMFYTIDSGEVMVVYRRFLGGTTHNTIAREGFHVIPPWDRAYIYEVKNQTIVAPMTVLSRNGLQVSLDAQIRFHLVPETVPYMHRQYGPDYVNTVIKPELTEAVQQVIGQYLPEELYSPEHGESAARVFDNAKRLIGGVFVVVDSIALLNVKLPEIVQTAVQKKAAAEQDALAHNFVVEKEKKEAERKLIEAKSLDRYAAEVSHIPQSVLVWKGIEASLELAKSPNSKVIVMGGKDSLPLVLGNVPDVAGK